MVCVGDPADADTRLCEPTIVGAMATSVPSAARFGDGGVFGEWVVDGDGLPAFDYKCPPEYRRHFVGEAGAEAGAKGPSSTHKLYSHRHWHQVGNDSIVALAFNNGAVSLFDFSRGPRYMNYLPSDADVRADNAREDPGSPTSAPRVPRDGSRSLRKSRRHRAPPRGAHCYGGGFGWVRDLDDDRCGCTAPRATWTEDDKPRITFGVGYCETTTRPCDAGDGGPLGLEVRRRVSAPYGRVATHLLSHVTVRNEDTSRARRIRLWEYWDVNPRWLGWNATEKERTAAAATLKYEVQRVGSVEAGVQGLAAREEHTAASQPWLKRQVPFVPPKPGPTVYLLCLNANVTGVDMDADVFFGADGTCERPAVVSAGRCAASQHTRPSGEEELHADESAPDHYKGKKRHPALVLQVDLDIPAGGEVTAVFSFGFAYPEGNPGEGRHGETQLHLDEDRRVTLPGDVVAPIPGDAMLASHRSARQWAAWLPRVELPDSGEDAVAVSRELAWHAYYTRSSGQFDAYFDRHTLTQGFYYQFATGNHSNARDPLQAAFPMVYFEPQAAKDTLISVLSQATEDGEIPYAMQGHGLREPIIWTPGDTDIFVLWLVCEYVFVTRDFGLLGERVPYSVDHARRRTLWQRIGHLWAIFVLKAMLVVHTIGVHLARTLRCVSRVCGRGRCEARVTECRRQRLTSQFWLKLILWMPWSLAKAPTVPPAHYLRYLPLSREHDVRSGTVWEHLVTAYQHLSSSEGIGFSRRSPNLLRVRHGDWHDGIMELLPLHSRAGFMRDGASVLTSAHAAYVLPRFAALADQFGDSQLAADARTVAERLAAGVTSRWNGQWFARAVAADGTVVGDDHLFAEPQPWAVLAGLADADRCATLMQAIDKNLREGSALGARNVGPIPDGDGTRGSGTRGGVWASLSHPLVWAAGNAATEFGVEPVGARSLAWSEFKSQLLANHARTYPKVWEGVWSGPDAYDSELSPTPGQVWNAGAFKLWCSKFPIQNCHAHAQPLLSGIRLAGIEATPNGMRIRTCAAPSVATREAWSANPGTPLPCLRVTSSPIAVEAVAGSFTVSLATAGRHIELELWLPWWWAEADSNPTCSVGGPQVAYCGVRGAAACVRTTAAGVAARATASTKDAFCACVTVRLEQPEGGRWEVTVSKTTTYVE